MTINRYCASGLQSIALAAERIRGGGAEVIVAGGAESMSYVPFGGNKISVNPWLVENYPGIVYVDGADGGAGGEALRDYARGSRMQFALSQPSEGAGGDCGGAVRG